MDSAMNMHAQDQNFRLWPRLSHCRLCQRLAQKMPQSDARSSGYGCIWLTLIQRHRLKKKKYPKLREPGTFPTLA